MRGTPKSVCSDTQSNPWAIFNKLLSENFWRNFQNNFLINPWKKFQEISGEVLEATQLWYNCQRYLPGIYLRKI